MMILAIVGALAVVAIGWYISFRVGVRIGKEACAENVADQIKGAHANGIRAGKRAMLDELRFAHLINDEAAEALASDI